MRHSVRAVTQADHVSHLEGVTTHVWQSIHFKRAGKLSDVGRDLEFRGFTLVLLYCAAWLLGTEDQNMTITDVSQGLFYY